jgi:hypothetical protein
MQKTLATQLAAHEGRLEEEVYGEAVGWRVWLPLASWDGFARAVREQTQGRIALQDDERDAL